MRYVQTCFLLYEVQLYEVPVNISQDMIKDLEVPFLPSKACKIKIPYEHHTTWLSLVGQKAALIPVYKYWGWRVKSMKA